jgi:hypothetical protein
MTTGKRNLQKPTIGAGLTAMLLFALAACGPEADKTNANEAANAAAPAAAAKAPAAPAAAPAERSPLVLEGAGIGIPDASPPRIVSFDTARPSAIDAVTKALGRPPSKLGENGECGGGGLEFAEWTDEITLWFEGGRFAGWDNKGKLKTSGGIGIGSTRTDLAQLAGFEVEESTLGTEFRAGGLSGILSSNAPGAKVTALWGGTTCVFR